ncbi:MAG: carbohydrate-binding family 9-like protein [Tannerellaceae bacterium]
MKRLKVPYLATLDVLDLSSVGFLMEIKAYRDYINVINWETYPYKPIVAFDIARTNETLYIRYNVRGNSLKACYKEDGSPVHKDSCVEFFMKTPNDHNYMNFEFNCIGTCDAAQRQSRDIKKSLTSAEYATIRRYSSLENKTFDEKLGVYAWEVIVAIPFRLMGLDPENLPEKINANFYKCADETEFPHFLSWNPIDLPEPDFHCPEFFGELYLK